MKWLVARRSSCMDNAGCAQRGHVLHSELLVFRTPTTGDMVPQLRRLATRPHSVGWAGRQTGSCPERVESGGWWRFPARDPTAIGPQISHSFLSIAGRTDASVWC